MLLYELNEEYVFCLCPDGAFLMGEEHLPSLYLNSDMTTVYNALREREDGITEEGLLHLLQGTYGMSQCAAVELLHSMKALQVLIPAVSQCGCKDE